MKIGFRTFKLIHMRSFSFDVFHFDDMTILSAIFWNRSFSIDIGLK